jgi:hypothetical protein
MKFVSVPFEKALGSLIEERRQRVHQMEQWKKELLTIWRSLPSPEDKATRKETFQVLEGRRQLGVKATEILNGCTSEIHMVLRDERPSSGLYRCVSEREETCPRAPRQDCGGDWRTG